VKFGTRSFEPSLSLRRCCTISGICKHEATLSRMPTFSRKWHRYIRADRWLKAERQRHLIRVDVALNTLTTARQWYMT